MNKVVLIFGTMSQLKESVDQELLETDEIGVIRPPSRPSDCTIFQDGYMMLLWI